MKRLFIIGCPRSGTSWVRQLLGAHPRVAAAEETPLYYRYLRPWDEAWQAERAARPHDVRLSDFLDDAEFDELLRAASERVLGKIAARRPGAEVVVDKTPNNTLDWRLILRLHPDALFLHVVRDPRDVVCSIRAAALGFGAAWAPRRVVPAARLWRSHVEAAHAARAATPRFAELRYEDLLGDGAAELARVLSWLGLPPDAAFCAATVAEWRHQGARGAGAWRGELAGGEARAVELVAGPWLETFGYAREGRGAGRPLVIWTDELRTLATRAAEVAGAGARRLLFRLAVARSRWRV